MSRTKNDYHDAIMECRRRQAEANIAGDRVLAIALEDQIAHLRKCMDDAPYYPGPVIEP